MPTYTGRDIVTSALRRAGILDPSQSALPEELTNALNLATDILDNWRTQRLTISGVTRNVYSLTANQQTRTIGSGGNFDQTYPTSIERWSVIPDDDAADPVEISMGRPLNSAEWQRVAVKSLTGAYPRKMYYDRSYSAGLGNCLFWPIPDNGDVDVALYCRLAAITSLVVGTSYNLSPGVARALKLGLAVEYCDEYHREVPDRLERAAMKAMGDLKRFNIIPHQAGVRREFLIGTRRKGVNIYTDR